MKGGTAVTPDTALRLARAFGTTPEYWINMQTAFDMAWAAKTMDVSGIDPIAV